MNLSEAQKKQIIWENQMYDQAMAIEEPQKPHGPCEDHVQLFDATRAAEQARACAVCWTCPMIAHCLREALDNRDPWGIWGGMLPRERARVHQRRLGRQFSVYRFIYGADEPGLEDAA